MKKSTKSSRIKGITLIALVITIIVLLILAGISISMLSGDNSILNQAGRAKKITGERSISEKVQLAYTGALANGKGNVERADLLSELQKEFGEDKINDGNIANDLTKVTIDGIDYGFDGTVTYEGDSLVEQADGTFKDSKGNEWVWIEVPNDGTGPRYPENASDAQIEAELRTYCGDVVASGTTEGDYKTTTCGFTDTWYDGCGLSENEYNTTKSAMLRSIKDNGGFYIGKYETGIENIYRTALNAQEYWSVDEDYPATETAVIKKNAYPYNYITCAQAEILAKGFAIEGKHASLLFGIQWDLVLKHLSNKGVAISLLNDNSTTWGNYKNNAYSLTNTEGGYLVVPDVGSHGDNWTNGTHNKSSNEGILITTGSHNDFSKQNIYDLAGNLFEWTLEHYPNSRYPCCVRSGRYDLNGNEYPASSHCCFEIIGASYNIGFRVALY